MFNFSFILFLILLNYLVIFMHQFFYAADFLLYLKGFGGSDSLTGHGMLDVAYPQIFAYLNSGNNFQLFAWLYSSQDNVYVLSLMTFF